MKKGVIILSGGIDSVTLAHYLKNQGYELYGLSFLYGQRHSIETTFAKYWGDKLLKEHQVVDLSNIQSLISKGSLTGGKDVPEGFYSETIQRQTIVPNRNMIMLSIATGYAVTKEVPEVFYAAHNSDYEVYTDCRKEFVKALDSAIYLGNLWTPVELKAPFIDYNKTKVVKTALDLKVDISKTWSCYQPVTRADGTLRSCGKCSTCVELTEACLENNIKYPHLSDEEWKEAVEFYNQKKEELNG